MSVTKDEIYNDIICPISVQIFNQPVIASDKKVYEKMCITKWFSLNQTSPLTGEILTDFNLADSVLIKQLVDNFLEKYPDYKDQQYQIPIQYLTEEDCPNIVDSKNYFKIFEFNRIDLKILI